MSEDPTVDEERTPARAAEPSWSAGLHELWSLADSAKDVTALADRLYDIMLGLPGVVAVSGSRWEGTRLAYLRWGTLHSPGPHRRAGRDGEEAAPAHRTPGDTTEITGVPASTLSDPGWPEAAPLAEAGARSALVCSFRLDSQEWARLTLGLAAPQAPQDTAPDAPQDAAPDAPHDTARDTFLRTALRQACEIVIACQRRLLAQRETERRQTIDAFLAEASLQMDATLDAEETLRRVARLAVPAIAEGCVLHLLRNRRLEPVATTHVAAGEERGLTGLTGDPWFQDLLRRVMKSEQPLVLDSTDLKGGPFGPGGRGAALDVRSLSVSPLRARGRLLGTLTFLHQSDRPDAMSAWFLTDLARRAALAIDTCLLYEQRRQDVVSLQRHLLPSGLPEVPGVDLGAAYGVADASLEVGGDFYDVIRARDGEFALFVGDVCGRGAEAAALTGLARHTLRVLLEDGCPPERALARLNTVLRQQKASRFLTATVASCVPDEDGSGALRVRIASAGHPVPLIRRAGGTVEEVAVGGLMLGVFDDAVCRPVTRRLAPGEMLVLYTDGLTEARTQDGTFFETLMPSRIAAAVPPGGGGAARLAEGLVGAATAFRHVGADDMAVLVAGVEGER
ncbi:PP2C family protein-serine/threonine phosphatase [Streptomyces sp. JL4002]|uniref:PP2C family protein-serine/threonine phosphatase n=1 Tax=Streptomyces sp. JL4002 TaxID=3404781 RepID=UPI003B2869CB